MTESAIAYNNLLESATGVIASGETAGNEVVNIIDWRTNTSWRAVTDGINTVTGTWASNITADVMAFFRHNLNDSTVNISLQYWDGVSAWLPILNTFSPIGGIFFYVFPSPINASQFRIQLNSSGLIPIIGHWFVGQCLKFRGPSPIFSPALYRDTSRFKTSISEGGQFVGRTYESSSARTTLNVVLLDPSGVTNEWEPFLERSKYYPFYYSWNYANQDKQAAYCWTDRTPLRAEYYRTPQFMRVVGNLQARNR